MKTTNLTLVILLSVCTILFSQTTDTLKNYNLKEIKVQSGLLLEPKRIVKIPEIKIEHADADNLFQTAAQVPSVKLQNNSRGESLIYLRGSNKRQLLLFFDGIPLNIPWDNRMDLSLIPVNAISSISVTKGVPSIVYGANTPAGAVNIVTKEFNGTPERKLKAGFGENGYMNYSGLYVDGFKNFSYVISAGYSETDGYTLPDSYSSDFENNVRWNSGSNKFNVYAKAKYNYSDFSYVELSAFSISADKQVPPEMHEAEPRLWRYSDWNRNTVILDGSTTLEKHNNSILTYAVAATFFRQTIDDYGNDISFTNIDESEKDINNTFYGRVNYSRFFGSSSLLKLAASGYKTNHTVDNLTNDTQEDYSQNVYSFGAEYEYFGDNYSALLGVSYDGTAYTETGGKPEMDNFSQPAVNGSFTYQVNPKWNMQLNLGIKPRFAAPRELFSSALNKFETNPDLKPETIYSAEINAGYKEQKFESNLALFVNYLQDGIIRIKLDNGKYKRINKEEIMGYGTEFLFGTELTGNLKLSGNVTYLYSRGKNEDGEFKDTLEYKPEVIAGLNLNYTFVKNANFTLEGYYTSVEYGAGSNGFERVPDNVLVNARLSYSIPFYNQSAEIYTRVNNIFDKLYYTQLGLPEPGRQFFAGVILDF